MDKKKRYEIIKQLRESGKSYRIIGELLNLSHQYVYNLYNNVNSISWDKRDSILILNGKKCFICGIKEKIQIHHKDRDCHNNNYNNLVLLCKKHHMEVHKILNEKDREIVK